MFLAVVYSLSIRLIRISFNQFFKKSSIAVLVSLLRREGKAVAAGDKSPRVSTCFVFGGAKRKTLEADNAS